jgi:hypothetical protein
MSTGLDYGPGPNVHSTGNMARACGVTGWRGMACFLAVRRWTRSYGTDATPTTNHGHHAATPRPRPHGRDARAPRQGGKSSLVRWHSRWKMVTQRLEAPRMGLAGAREAHGHMTTV